WLLTEAMWAPATPTYADAISKPDCCWALATEASIDSTASSTLTMMPFFRPREGTTPTPITSSWSSSVTAAISVHTLVVPTSIPTTIRSRAIRLLAPGLAEVGPAGEPQVDQARLTAGAGQLRSQRHQRRQLGLQG